MKYAKQSAVALLLMLAVVSQAACDPKALRESRKAAHRIQITIDAAIDTLIALHDKKIVSDADTKKISLGLQGINDANAKLIAHAKAATADTPQTRQQLLTDLDDIIRLVDELEPTGILEIKGETGKAAFGGILATLRASIAVVKGVLQ